MSDNHIYLIKNVLTNLKEFFNGRIYALEKNDETALNKEYQFTDDDAAEFIKHQTGFNRVKDMFFPESYLKMSPQMEIVVRTSIQTGLTFAAFASLFGGMAAKERFLLKTKHKSYTTKFLATRSYKDASMIGFLRYGFRFGFKVGIFSGLFMVISQSISVYRNKTGIIEHVIAGGLTCGTLRINGGPKAFIGAGTIGLFLGLVSGIAINSILSLFGYSQEQINFETIKDRYQFERP